MLGVPRLPAPLPHLLGLLLLSLCFSLSLMSLFFLSALFWLLLAELALEDLSYLRS